ncbi:uncharacterized protein LOC124257387 [Haliotis rubra]|uniref:uncharacterized protein LOC124257387 n=1 Tax=Haliotis rubra TaxID=36100 RepID=UPI001EE5B78B|nr:uncharacterized protein LOC124257387 [Haliotis rubra]
MNPTNSGSARNDKKRRLETEDISAPNPQDNWARFVVIEATNGEPLKLNPFLISKTIQSICGEVKNVSCLQGGQLLVECARKQQSINLLQQHHLANVSVGVTAPKTLNSSRGIVRDRARCLADMSMDEIVEELQDQNVTSVKRFTVKKYDGSTVPSNTYLFTFSMSTVPKSIKAGFFNIRVEVYIPSPLRCYSCQKFGHGSKSCRNAHRCHRCSEDHLDSDCSKDPKYVNCGGDHVSSSKSCPEWQIQSKILKFKYENNVSLLEAKKQVSHQLNSNLLRLLAIQLLYRENLIQCQFPAKLI